MANIDRKDSFKVLDSIGGKPFDPRTTTLREYILAYSEVAIQEKDRTGYRNQFLSPKTKMGKHFSEYADLPLVTLFRDTMDDDFNPLANAFAETESGDTQRGMYSNVKGLEYNFNSAMTRLGLYEAEFPDGPPTIVGRVVNPDKGKPKGARYQFQPGAYGKLQYALAEWARKNPNDAGVVRALEMQMLTGFRPGEVANMPLSALVEPAELSASYGIYLSTDIEGVKMEKPLNVPAGPRELHVLNTAIEFKEGLGQAAEANGNIFVNPDGSPVTTGQMTKLIKQIKVPGIMFDTLTNTPLDSLQEAYDLRRLHATTAFQIFGDYNRGAAMRGRAVKVGGAEPDYVSPARGFYDKRLLEPHIIMDDFFNDAYAKEVARNAEDAPGTLTGLTPSVADAYQVEARQTTSRIKAPGMRVDYKIDLTSGVVPFVADNIELDMQGTSVSNLITRVRPPKSAAGQQVVKPGKLSNDAILDLYDEMMEGIMDETPPSDTSSGGLRGKGKLGLALAITGMSYQQGKTEAREAGLPPEEEWKGGVARTVVDVAEPMAVSFMMGEMAGPEAQDIRDPKTGQLYDTPAARLEVLGAQKEEQATIAEQMGRIQQYDKRQATIDEQMSRIRQYEENQ